MEIMQGRKTKVDLNELLTLISDHEIEESLFYWIKTAKLRLRNVVKTKPIQFNHIEEDPNIHFISNYKPLYINDHRLYSYIQMLLNDIEYREIVLKEHEEIFNEHLNVGNNP